MSTLCILSSRDKLCLYRSSKLLCIIHITHSYYSSDFASSDLGEAENTALTRERVNLRERRLWLAVVVSVLAVVHIDLAVQLFRCEQIRIAAKASHRGCRGFFPQHHARRAPRLLP